MAQLVLCVPHSNVDSQRTLSVIRIKKKEFRNRLSLEGTLSSIRRHQCIKMNNIEPCYEYKRPSEMIKMSESPKAEYYNEHSK